MPAIVYPIATMQLMPQIRVIPLRRRRLNVNKRERCQNLRQNQHPL